MRTKMIVCAIKHKPQVPPSWIAQNIHAYIPTYILHYKHEAVWIPKSGAPKNTCPCKDTIQHSKMLSMQGCVTAGIGYMMCIVTYHDPRACIYTHTHMCVCVCIYAAIWQGLSKSLHSHRLGNIKYFIDTKLYSNPISKLSPLSPIVDECIITSYSAGSPIAEVSGTLEPSNYTPSLTALIQLSREAIQTELKE